ncbi:uncharacterized protein AB675_464 [Cyphellophora attinorum]|uniref:Uncharacterized protein n=1 Tax=Cyphellophora attinorum TaxID=1664694 RepID=A0A0N1P3N2_9EURO|nr:uncharacterized protein AB675_464 [Phialophora attinorum]KPI45715.1 hypothetical protein AB675_464 [Phialophora attinorum]
METIDGQRTTSADQTPAVLIDQQGRCFVQCHPNPVLLDVGDQSPAPWSVNLSSGNALSGLVPKGSPLNFVERPLTEVAAYDVHTWASTDGHGRSVTLPLSNSTFSGQEFGPAGFQQQGFLTQEPASADVLRSADHGGSSKCDDDAANLVFDFNCAFCLADHKVTTDGGHLTQRDRYFFRALPGCGQAVKGSDNVGPRLYVAHHNEEDYSQFRCKSPGCKGWCVSNTQTLNLPASLIP